MYNESMNNNIFNGHPTLREFLNLVVETGASRNSPDEGSVEISLSTDGVETDPIINESLDWYGLYAIGDIYDGMDDDEMERVMYQLELVPGNIVDIEDIQEILDDRRDHLDEPLSVFKFGGWESEGVPVWDELRVNRVVVEPGKVTVVC